MNEVLFLMLSSLLTNVFKIGNARNLHMGLWNFDQKSSINTDISDWPCVLWSGERESGKEGQSVIQGLAHMNGAVMKMQVDAETTALFLLTTNWWQSLVRAVLALSGSSSRGSRVPQLSRVVCSSLECPFLVYTFFQGATCNSCIFASWFRERLHKIATAAL